MRHVVMEVGGVEDHARASVVVLEFRYGVVLVVLPEDVTDVVQAHYGNLTPTGLARKGCQPLHVIGPVMYGFRAGDPAQPPRLESHGDPGVPPVIKKGGFSRWAVALHER